MKLFRENENGQFEPVTDQVIVDRAVVERTVERLRATLPSFRDPRHYADHADIAMVRHLEATLVSDGSKP